MYTKLMIGPETAPTAQVSSRRSAYGIILKLYSESNGCPPTSHASLVNIATITPTNAAPNSTENHPPPKYKAG